MGFCGKRQRSPAKKWLSCKTTGANLLKSLTTETAIQITVLACPCTVRGAGTHVFFILGTVRYGVITVGVKMWDRSVGAWCWLRWCCGHVRCITSDLLTTLTRYIIHSTYGWDLCVMWAPVSIIIIMLVIDNYSFLRKNY